MLLVTALYPLQWVLVDYRMENKMLYLVVKIVAKDTSSTKAAHLL